MSLCYIITGNSASQHKRTCKLKQKNKQQKVGKTWRCRSCRHSVLNYLDKDGEVEDCEEDPQDADDEHDETDDGVRRSA